MIPRPIKAVISTVGLFFCAWLALKSAVFFPHAGRSILPMLLVMAVLIAIFGLTLRCIAGWHFWDFIIGVLPVEFFTLLIISFFSGYTWFRLLDTYNLHTLFEISLFILPPWLLGYALGCGCMKVFGKTAISEAGGVGPESV